MNYLNKINYNHLIEILNSGAYKKIIVTFYFSLFLIISVKAIYVERCIKCSNFLIYKQKYINWKKN